MNQMDKISVIVPIYNTDQYLDRCIQSIINQTYTNLEILLVNDGSTDNSIKICEEYKKKDKRIKVINKTNGGPGSTKNVGVDNATGEYIGFVDSDDYIDNDMFEVLYNTCVENNADIAMVAFNRIINGKTMKTMDFDGKTIVFNKFEAMKELLLDREIKNYSWNKLFKKEIYDGVRFPENLKYEDIDISVRLFEKINKLAYKKVPKYYYVERDDSIVNCKLYSSYRDYVTVTNRRYEYLKNKYKEIEKYNAMGFIANMTIIYKNAVINDMDELYSDFEKNYDLFVSLTTKYKNDCLCELNNYKRLLFCIILWDLDMGRKITKELESQIKKNRKLY